MQALLDCPPSEFAEAVTRAAASAGLGGGVVYLVDYAHQRLVPLPGEYAGDRRSLAIDGSLAGRAFVSSEPQVGEGPTDGGPNECAMTVWCPLLDGAHRLGVVEVSAGSTGSARAAVSLARDIATALIVQDRCSDVFAFVRRSRPLTVAAEMQWALLPPTTINAGRVEIAGILEPAHSVAGDAFDYSLNGETAHVAVFDAMGHGLPSASLTAVAVGAYRNARRALFGLEETVWHVERALAEVTGAERFVTAVIAEIDLVEGILHWVSAGHPHPLVLRGRSLVGQPVTDSDPPLGLGLLETPSTTTLALQPDDSVLLYTDGVTESRRSSEFFTIERLVDFVTREHGSGLGTAETLRRLTTSILHFQDGVLQDDASVVLASWLGRAGRV